MNEKPKNEAQESSSNASSVDVSAKIAEWVDEHGDGLLRYALLRLHDRAAAEDVVQETFLAAFKSYDSFRGDSKVETWLTSILRNKIVDSIRKQSSDKAQAMESIDEVASESAMPGNQRINAWTQDPALAFENTEFWSTFHRCVGKLPENLAECYMMRESLGLDIKEICKVLKITPTNASVRIYRARALLRQCLDKNWFQTAPSST